MRKILWVFLIIFVVSVSLWGWIMYRGREWRDAVSGQRTLVVFHPATSEVLRPVSLVVWRPDSQELLVIPIPEQLEFPWSLNGQEYSLWALTRLAEIEAWTPQQWHRELTLQFGVIIDGEIHVDVPQQELSADDVLSESRWALLGRRSTSLSLWDRWLWWRGIKDTDALRREVVPFEEAWINADNELNTGTYDRFARLRLQDERVRESAWALRVVNSSGVSGEAARYARMLELTGYNVFSLETQTELSQPTVRLYVDPAAAEGSSAWAAGRLQTLFADWSIEIDPLQADQERTEAEVVLGN